MTKIRTTIAILACALATGGGVAWATSPQGHPAQGHPTHPPIELHFKGAQLTALTQATAYAAWCGGEVLIDTDDGEVLTSHCDR